MLSSVYYAPFLVCVVAYMALMLSTSLSYIGRGKKSREEAPCFSIRLICPFSPIVLKTIKFLASLDKKVFSAHA